MMKINRLRANISVKILTDEDLLWEQVHYNNTYSIYHSKIWKTLIEEIFNHTAMYLAATNNGILIDMLPFFLVKNPFIGRKLISAPYEGCNGGFSSSIPSVRKILIDQIKRHALSLNVQYIEIRSRSKVSELEEYGFVEKTFFLLSEIPLIDSDENWKMLSPGHRKNVRIALKRGITIHPASSVTEMKTFYKIITNHYKQLGMPFLGEKFFIQIWDNLIQKKLAGLLLAKLHGEIVGGTLHLFSGKNLISKYSACKKDNEHKKLKASYALLWEGIQFGINNNFKNFDLGITEKSLAGLLDFKSRFGSRTTPLYYYYYPISGKIPDFSRYFSEYTFLKKIWRAMPKFLTYSIGRKINEWIC